VIFLCGLDGAVESANKFCMDAKFKQLNGKLLRVLRSRLSRTARALLTVSKPLPRISFDTAALRALPPLRYGLIGLGVMGRSHLRILQKRPYAKIVGITGGRSAEPTAGKEIRRFDSSEQMIQSGEVDVVVIASPHRLHPELTIAALNAGLHVICEKPLAISVGQADAVLNTAAQSKKIFTIVYQSRYEPAYQFAKSLLEKGELGRIVRCDMVETNFRPQAYFGSSPWRGTWKGEGGGVLVNQAPHVLDRYAWLCGMPAKVIGVCATALHKIEVEDTFDAIFQHAGDAQGHVHVSINETPATSRVVIVCDRGRITIDQGEVSVDRLDDSIQNRCAAETRAFADIPGRTQRWAWAWMAWSDKLLELFHDNVALAIAGRNPLLVSAAEAAQEVELASAIQLSSATGQSVQLPVDRAQFDAFLAKKMGRAS
jgi:predicted dehydrogenase